MSPDTLSHYSNHSDRQKDAFVLLKLVSELPVLSLVVLRSEDLWHELEGHFQNSVRERDDKFSGDK